MGGLAPVPVSPHPRHHRHPFGEVPAPGEAGGADGGGDRTDPRSRGTNPKPVPGAGRRLRGDPEPAAGTVQLSRELAQATTCSPQPLLPVPSLPPAAPPGPGLILMLALPLRSCISRARLSKPKERARGLRGLPEGAARGEPLGWCRGSAGGRSGGQEGGLAAGRRQGRRVPVGCRGSLLYSTSCCCWVASLTTCKERGTVRYHAVLALETRAWGQEPCSVPPASPLTPQCLPVLTSPSRVSMVLIITVFLVCTSEPRCSGLVSAGGKTQGMGPRGCVAWGHSSGAEATGGLQEPWFQPPSNLWQHPTKCPHRHVSLTCQPNCIPQRERFTPPLRTPRDSSQATLLTV